jgi:hypothetical protein
VIEVFDRRNVGPALRRTRACDRRNDDGSAAIRDDTTLCDLTDTGVEDTDECLRSARRSSANVQAKIHSIVLASAAPGFAFLHKRGWRTPGPRNANANSESTRRWLVATRRFLELLDGAVPVRLEIDKSVPLARVYR